MAPKTRLAWGRPHYAWIVLAVTFATLLVAGATRATPGVLIVPLEQHFGWSRATISLAVSLNLVLFGLMGPFSAALVEYLGARRTMMGALLLVSSGVALTALMEHVWQLILLWGLVVGAGTGMMAPALGATVVNRWFTERRGLAMGILTASNATGQLLFLPLLASLVESYGWQMVSLVVAGFGLAMIPVIALFMRNHLAENDVEVVSMGSFHYEVDYEMAGISPQSIIDGAIALDDPRAQVLVWHKEDVAIGGRGADDFLGVATGADDVGERFDAGATVDVGDDVVVLLGARFQELREFFRRARFGE